MSRIDDYDRGMKKRIKIIAPLVILAHALAFFSFGETVSPDRTITFGFEGPPRLTPDISILNDRSAAGQVAQRPRNVLSDINVFIEEEDTPKREKGTVPTPPAAKRETERHVSIASSGDDYYRTYPSHASVPYREDYVILRMVQPDYPPDALAHADEGYVLVEAYIGTDGSVKDVWVRSASGPRSFETATLEAVRQFLFKPVNVDGAPISFWVSFLVRFQLKR
jgi:TonB family protein